MKSTYKSGERQNEAEPEDNVAQRSCKLKYFYTAQKTEDVKATSVLLHQVILWDPKPWLIEDILMKFHGLHEGGLKAGFFYAKKKKRCLEATSMLGTRESQTHVLCKLAK